MTDAGFVLAGYAVVVGGLLAYCLGLLRRIARARRRAAIMTAEAARRGESTPPSALTREPEMEP